MLDICWDIDQNPPRLVKIDPLERPVKFLEMAIHSIVDPQFDFVTDCILAEDTDSIRLIFSITVPPSFSLGRDKFIAGRIQLPGDFDEDLLSRELHRVCAIIKEDAPFLLRDEVLAEICRAKAIGEWCKKILDEEYEKENDND